MFSISTAFYLVKPYCKTWYLPPRFYKDAFKGDEKYNFCGKNEENAVTQNTKQGRKNLSTK